MFVIIIICSGILSLLLLRTAGLNPSWDFYSFYCLVNFLLNYNWYRYIPSTHVYMPLLSKEGTSGTGGVVIITCYQLPFCLGHQPHLPHFSHLILNSAPTHHPSMHLGTSSNFNIIGTLHPYLQSIPVPATFLGTVLETSPTKLRTQENMHAQCNVGRGTSTDWSVIGHKTRNSCLPQVSHRSDPSVV